MQFILTAEEVPSSKKTPEMFLKAAERLHSTPAETLVVEDSLHCIETAVQGGFPVIAVHDAAVPEEEQKKIQALANLYGRDLKELIEKLKF